MAARSSLLRRAIRHASSVVAALAALAPRLVRLAHHDYPDGLLGGCPRLVCLARHGDPDSLLADDPAADNPKRGGGAARRLRRERRARAAAQRRAGRSCLPRTGTPR